MQRQGALFDVAPPGQRSEPLRGYASLQSNPSEKTRVEQTHDDREIENGREAPWDGR